MNTNINIIKTENLGECSFDSPLKTTTNTFVDNEGVICETHASDLISHDEKNPLQFFELAGAREKIHFNPAKTTIGIVTCGGLCPGLNDVIRAITFCALKQYKVNKVLGFKYGYEGLVAKYYHPPIELNTENTDEIHEKGGTILGSSRGQQPDAEIVNTLKHYQVDILFTIGGDGTQRGASDICAEIKRQNADIAVIGIPKTIDNDIGCLERSFGFDSAIDAAWQVINSAHAESKAYKNGIGLVKLMGRDSGWITAYASLSNSNVNFCLIPEVDFDLDGPNGFLNQLKTRLDKSKHAVIAIAEGAGQKLMNETNQKDKSGNKKLADIGIFLKDNILDFFKKENIEVNLKYFDPSYLIRSIPANAGDSAYCLRLGYNAVHAAMAGKTNLIIGLHTNRIVHIPISMISTRKYIDPNKWLWQTVLQTTGQPRNMINV